MGNWIDSETLINGGNYSRVPIRRIEFREVPSVVTPKLLLCICNYFDHMPRELWFYEEFSKFSWHPKSDELPGNCIGKLAETLYGVYWEALQHKFDVKMCSLLINVNGITLISATGETRVSVKDNCVEVEFKGASERKISYAILEEVSHDTELAKHNLLTVLTTSATL